MGTDHDVICGPVCQPSVHLYLIFFCWYNKECPLLSCLLWLLDHNSPRAWLLGPPSNPAGHRDDCGARLPWPGASPGLYCLGAACPWLSADRVLRSCTCRQPSSFRRTAAPSAAEMRVLLRSLQMVHPPSLSLGRATRLPSAWHSVSTAGACFPEPLRPFLTVCCSHPGISALTRVAVAGSGSQEPPESVSTPSSPHPCWS